MAAPSWTVATYRGPEENPFGPLEAHPVTRAFPRADSAKDLLLPHAKGGFVRGAVFFGDRLTLEAGI